MHVEKPLVIYHSPCLDGFTAAWACWLKYPEAEFVPAAYGQEPPDCEGRDVYLLDFSYKYDVMLEMYRKAKSIVVLDHHKTAEAELASMFADGWLGGSFAMEKSGARLAWEFFHPDKAVPRLVRYVEDRDLWRFALDHSKSINAALFSHEYDFEVWSRLAKRMEESSIEGPVGLLNFIEEGEAIERKHMKDVRELVGKLKHWRRFKRLLQHGDVECTQDMDCECCNELVGWLDGDGQLIQVPCANLPYVYASDAAGLMAEGAPFAATYYQDADGAFVFSLRSRGEGGADVSEVAARYGGGGHKHAAGFRVASLEEL